jgi:hypothetical protein
MELLVTVDHGTAILREVSLRTEQMRRGVLCDVKLDGRLHLCVIDRIVAEGEIAVRRLPEPPRHS